MAVFGQVPAQGVDALRPLPHQQIAGPEHNSVRLPCLVFHRHKAHPRPLRRFADRLSIRHVILLPLDEGLYVSGGISRTVWPSLPSSRAQECAPPQASSATRQGGCPAKTSTTLARTRRL